jgi:hypothetical protein
VGPVDAGWKEVTGRRINKLTTNKPTLGYVEVNNEYNALSSSIDDTPDRLPIFWFWIFLVLGSVNCSVN